MAPDEKDSDLRLHRAYFAGLWRDGGTATSSSLDGRTARREQNRLAAIDAGIELFSAENLRPTPQQVADKTGLSLKSIQRYFEDENELISLAVDRKIAEVVPLFRISAIGQGALDGRIDRIVDSRVLAYPAVSSTVRAAELLAQSSPTMSINFNYAIEVLRIQVARQFEPEFEKMPAERRDHAITAVEVLLSFPSLHHCFNIRGLEEAEVRQLLHEGIFSLVQGSPQPS